MIAVMRHRCETMTHCGPDAVIYFPSNLIRQGERAGFLHTILHQHVNVIKNNSGWGGSVFISHQHQNWDINHWFYKKKRSLFPRCKALSDSAWVLLTSPPHVFASLWPDHSDKPQWGLSECNNDDSRLTKLCREAEAPFCEVDGLKIPLGPSAAID